MKETINAVENNVMIPDAINNLVELIAERNDDELSVNGLRIKHTNCWSLPTVSYFWIERLTTYSQDMV